MAAGTKPVHPGGRTSDGGLKKLTDRQHRKLTSPRERETEEHQGVRRCCPAGARQRFIHFLIVYRRGRNLFIRMSPGKIEGPSSRRNVRGEESFARRAKVEVLS